MAPYIIHVSEQAEKLMRHWNTISPDQSIRTNPTRLVLCYCQQWKWTNAADDETHNKEFTLGIIRIIARKRICE